jgi:mono/diheme cytochrome c family protein
MAGLVQATQDQAQVQKPSSAAASAATPGNADNGKKLFIRDGCYECHGIEGQGANGLGPRLAPNPMSLPSLTSFLRKPKGAMPPYASSILPDAGIADIHAYLRSRPRPAAITVVPSFETKRP